MAYLKTSPLLVAIIVGINFFGYALASPTEGQSNVAKRLVKLPQLLCHHQTSTCLHYTVTKTKTIRPKETTVTKVKTTTATVTKVLTTSKVPVPTGSCPVVKQCKPVGWTVDYYANPFLGYSNTVGGGLGPGYYISENLTPLGQALTNITYFPQDSPPPFAPVVYPNSSYSQIPYYVGYTRDISGIKVDGNNYTLVYNGLYKAPTSGNFTFCSEADNEVAVFFGAGDGFPCGGKPSPSAPPSQLGTISTGGNYDNPTTCFSSILVQDSYYPLRLVMGNFDGPSALGFTITPPAGNSSYDQSGNIFSSSCASKL